uniref:Putative terminase n=1 Tax=viral metagenome TaxID=1070528 RepID=A0A6M3KY34_9ZZZZ
MNLTQIQESALLQDGYLEEILIHMKLDIEFFIRMLFPRQFSRQFSAEFAPLFEALDDRSIRQLLVIAFRGCGKTTLIRSGYAARSLLFNENQYLVYTSKSATLAVMETESLKVDLLTNEDIVKYFGSIRGEKQESFFSKDIWVTPKGNIVLPRGAGQQVRGINFRSIRPDLLITDDLEDPSDLKTEESVAKLRDWFFNSYVNIVDRGSKDWRHIIIGTVSLADSILWDLKKDKNNWTTIEIPLCEEKKGKYFSLWPEYMSDFEVNRFIQEQRDHKNLDGFYREYMNMLVGGEDAAFTQSMFRYYDEGDTEENWNDVRVAENIIMIDPAKTAKMTSAKSAIVCMGIGVKTNKWRVRDIVADFLTPDQLMNSAFDMAIFYNAHVIAIEITGLEDYVKHVYTDMMARRGLNFEAFWVKAIGKKEMRARELVPYYRQGLIEHNRSICEPLERALLTFPHCEYWDVLDAVAHTLKVLEECERFMDFEPGVGSSNDSDAQYESELKALEEEDSYEPIFDGWQTLI